MFNLRCLPVQPQSFPVVALNHFLKASLFSAPMVRATTSPMPLSSGLATIASAFAHSGQSFRGIGWIRFGAGRGCDANRGAVIRTELPHLRDARISEVNCDVVFPRFSLIRIPSRTSLTKTPFSKCFWFITRRNNHQDKWYQAQPKIAQHHCSQLRS